MTNRSSSKQHGLHRVKRTQPSVSHSRKANKAKSRVKQQARYAALQEALATK